MAAQLSYSYQTPRGVAGSLFDIAPYAINSRVNGETKPNVLMFGMGAVHGATPGVDVLAPTDADTADKFEGVVMTSFTNQMNMLGDIRIFHLQTVGILRYGHAWVRIVDGIEPEYGEALFLVNDGDDAGMFTNDPNEGIAIMGRFIGPAGTGPGSIGDGTTVPINIAPAEIYDQMNTAL